MNDDEFDIIDELYFVTSYNDLKVGTGYSDQELKINLKNMVQKGWIKIYKSVDEESEITELNYDQDFQSFFYLASKKGLFKHNSQ